jgi:hypothetical protein
MSTVEGRPRLRTSIAGKKRPRLKRNAAGRRIRLRRSVAERRIRAHSKGSARSFRIIPWFRENRLQKPEEFKNCSVW